MNIDRVITWITPRRLKRRILQDFINQIGGSGEGGFAGVLADLAAVYLHEGHLPPVWTEAPPGDGIISEW